ncbi:MAG: hypothetical protein ACQESW_07005 [Bacteroidota bacterium]
MKICQPLFLRYLMFVGIILLFAACNNADPDKQENTVRQEKLNEEASLLIKYSDNLFAVPSPFEATQLMAEAKVPFTPDLLHKPKHVEHYASNFQQALNLGIYGADLGYLTLYEQTPELIKYFAAVKHLARELDLLNQLSSNDIKRIENNLDNEDTLMHFFANTYKAFDSALQQDNRSEIGALIITGSWIESIHLLSEAALSTGNRSLINRLGEQKQPLNNLIELLSSYYYTNDSYTELIDALVDIAYEFDGIIFNYRYDSTAINEAKNTTIVYSHSNVIISKYHLRIINKKINKLRELITNT